MNTRTDAAFTALFDSIKDDPETLALYVELKAAVETEIMSHVEMKRSAVPRVRYQIFESLAFRAVLERAWKADPERTESDLNQAGGRDVAAELGAWWLSEQYRAAQAAEQMVRRVRGEAPPLASSCTPGAAARG